MANTISSVQNFLTAVQGTEYAHFAGRPGVRVASADAFAAMKSHVTDLYRGVQVVHSFEDDNGSVFDCIPVAQQPSLRGAAPATAPAAPAAPRPEGQGEATGNRQTTAITEPVNTGRKDRHGNDRSCPDGYIPMLRVTLETLTRFETLDHFFRKSPTGSGRPFKHSSQSLTSAPSTAVAATHRWAHAYQNVANLGGHDFINLWRPSVTGSQIFSLSQHWYTGGSGAALQTAEVGWQVYPGFYGNSNPCLFIYWTADDYKTTGCYNLTCSAFVQTNPAWTLGGSLGPVSSTGGTQYELEVAFYLNGGNWWLYLKGMSPSNAVGYYPTSIYSGGALASNASEIDYGGETVGTTSFPPMGSGAFANAGSQQACYQRQIFYFPTYGGTAGASLNESANWPSCYTTQLNNYGSPWNVTLWYGGPGGSC